LLYLLQYCEGKAKRLIEHSALLDPKKGYKKAKEILFENFGRKNVIARAYVSKLVKGPKRSQPPDEYCIQVHLFGAASSPSCANYCLKQEAIDQTDEFDLETTKSVRQNFYMDDYLKSVSSEEEATRLVSQIVLLLKNRGFRLTK